MNYRMELTGEEKAVLRGENGETLKKVMESVVLYGEAFGAERLVKLDGPVHLVTSFGVTIIKPVYEMMDELIEAGLKTVLPFTLDPRPLDFANVRPGLLEKLVFKIMYGKQGMYEEQLKEVGLRDEKAFSCTCYLPQVGNRPGRGDILAWAESSAVVFANSVLAARTNRNSAAVELLSGIIGKTPEFGFLRDEGRKADWLIELKTSELPNAQLLGSAVGMKVMEDVPYITGLDRFLGEGLKPETEDYLKDMGAATASNGAVGLYHVEGITPEAVEEGKVLLRDNYRSYTIDDQKLDRIYSTYPVVWRDANARPSLCFIGCPHLSLGQLEEWTGKINRYLNERARTGLAVKTLLCAAPEVLAEFKGGKHYRELIKTGAGLTSICPLMYINNPLSARKAVITNSNKLRTYSTARFVQDDDILPLLAERRRFNDYE